MSSASVEASAEASATPARRRGRPRDVQLEQRIIDTALELYAEAGWSGFNLDAIARRAGAGKEALYRRWSGKEDLLVQALSGLLPMSRAINTGSFREDLVELAGRQLSMHLDPRGLAILRLMVEARAHPDIFATISDAVNVVHVKSARAIVRRGVQRGELPPGTSATLILDTIMGGVLEHVMATPLALRPIMTTKSRSYVEQLVDFVIAGAKGV